MEGLHVDSHKMEIPIQWMDLYAKDWCQDIDQDDDVTKATILIGTDLALLFPINVLTSTGLPVETNIAVLMKSRITNKYLAFGYNTKNIKHNISTMMSNIDNFDSEEELEPYDITPDSEREEVHHVQRNDKYNIPVQPKIDTVHEVNTTVPEPINVQNQSEQSN